MEEEKGICPVCGTEFKKARKNHIYCSKKCTNYAWKNGYNKKRKQLEKDQIIHIRNSKKICDYCGKEFFGKRNSKYCSKACRRAMQLKKDMEKEKNKRAEKKNNRNKKYSKNEQPCWTCKKACGGCRWSDELKPVKGWDAVKVKRKDDSGEKNLFGYKIISCPEYENG